MSEPRTLTAVKTKPPAFLELRWAGGMKARVDLLNFVDRRSSVLGSAGLFMTARLRDRGRFVSWADGSQINADRLWLETLSVIGRGDVREFLEWRMRNALSLSGAAEALGVCRRTVAYCSNAEREVPRRILLACHGWEILHNKTQAQLGTALHDEVSEWKAYLEWARSGTCCGWQIR